MLLTSFYDINSQPLMRNAVHYRPSKNVAREESLEPALKPTHTIAREFLYPGEEEAV